MGVVKTLAVTVLALLLAKGVNAAGHDAAAEAPRFAACAGRLSAQMAHEWLMQSDTAEATERQRAHLLDILEAIADPGREADLLNSRIEAKAAHAALLRRATFGEDPLDRAWAARLAERHVRSCTSMLLSNAPDQPSLALPDGPFSTYS